VSDDREKVALTTYRRDGGSAAVVFVHGFASRGFPFGNFPELLAAEPGLKGWDLYAVGYNTDFAPDVRGLWAADPSIEILATYLRSRARLDPLGDYDGLAIVAHSMGGLVAQQALVQDEELADRVSHVFCFGTPSAGVRLARWARFFKRQVSDMAEEGPFIDELRSRWDKLWRSRPFELWVTAGDSDMFVPPTSSLDPFPEECRVVVPGSHSGIVNIDRPGTMSQQVVVEGLIGSAAPAGPWNSARVAVERRQFDEAVRTLLPAVAELDERHLVVLALALEGVGRHGEAVQILEEHGGMHGTDAKGALAGRHKRAWQAEGRRHDGEAAYSLYSEALAEATANADPEQCYYHAINVAFLELTFRGDRRAAEAAAGVAADHAAEAPPSAWRSATQAEAQLILGHYDQAMAQYAEAVAREPEPHALESTYGQAVMVLAELDEPGLKERLDAVFRPGEGASS
jgi:pimeloyl-ACP methyl ester carboxylesterase